MSIRSVFSYKVDFTRCRHQRWERSFWFAVLAIFVLALSLRLAYFNLVADGPLGNPDSPAYAALGDSLKGNKDYHTTRAGGPGGFPGDLQRPPGYPVFLALTNPSSGVNRQWTAIVQSVLSALFVIILTIFIGQVVNNLVGLMTGAFYACDWVSIIHTPMLIAETLFTVVITAAVFCFAYYLLKHQVLLAALAGGLLGVAALIKPVAQLVLIAFFLGWLFQPKRRWGGIVFLVVYMSCITPWMYRNYLRHQLFTLSAINTVNLYFYTAQGAAADYSWRELEIRINALDIVWKEMPYPPIVRKQQMEEEAWKLIKQNWSRMIKQSVIGFVRVCLGTSRETLFASFRDYHQSGLVWHTVVPLLQIMILWIGALAGGWVAHRERFLPPAVLVLLISTVLLVSLAANGLVANSRFRVPVTPLLCFFAAIGSFHFLTRFATDKHPWMLLGFQSSPQNLQQNEN